MHWKSGSLGEGGTWYDGHDKLVKEETLLEPQTFGKDMRCGGFHLAKKHLKDTTQKGIKTAIHLINKKDRIDHWGLYRKSNSMMQ